MRTPRMPTDTCSRAPVFRGSGHLAGDRAILTDQHRLPAFSADVSARPKPRWGLKNRPGTIVP